MKKLIITLTLGIAMMSVTSCRWIHETFYSIEGCAEWYCESLYEAAADDNVKEFIELADHYEQWLDNLNQLDEDLAEMAIENWLDKNERKGEFVDNYARTLDL